LKLDQTGRGDKPMFGYRAHNKVFNKFQENLLADYIKNSINYINLKLPKNWTDNEHAGIDWFQLS